MLRQYWRGNGAGWKVMWWCGNSTGFNISWWQGECRWWMWGYCDCQNDMWWEKLWECGELLYWRRFPLRVKGAFVSYIRPAILSECNAWCLKERWKCYEGQRYPWLEQCVQYSSKIEKSWRFYVHVGFEWNHRSVGYGCVCLYCLVLRREDGRRA